MDISLLLLSTNVTRTAPAFHNPGHIRLWNESPLRHFEPHLFMAVVLLIIIAGIVYFFYFKRKEALNEGLTDDKSDELFRELVAKKNILLNKIVQLEEDYEAGKIDEQQFQDKITAYKKYLYKVKQDLNKFLE